MSANVKFKTFFLKKGFFEPFYKVLLVAVFLKKYPIASSYQPEHDKSTGCYGSKESLKNLHQSHIRLCSSSKMQPGFIAFAFSHQNVVSSQCWQPPIHDPLETFFKIFFLHWAPLQQPSQRHRDRGALILKTPDLPKLARGCISTLVVLFHSKT